MKLSGEQITTIVAALRCWQRLKMPDLVQESPPDGKDIAFAYRGYFDDIEPLSSNDIDSLCRTLAEQIPVSASTH